MKTTDASDALCTQVILLGILEAAKQVGMPLSRRLLLAVRGANPDLVTACIDESGVLITE